jgi:hypothetical protein
MFTNKQANSLNWWVGVVEDRNDPEELGRCRVRIFGYHTEDKTILPTKDLPWALPLQPITSAAISGKGTAPVGLLEGSWVVGWFLDGADMQQPIMMGTIGGKNKSNPFEKETRVNNPDNNYVTSSDGKTVTDSSGEPILVASSVNNDSATKDYITNNLPPLSVANIKRLMDKIGESESSSVPGGRQNYREKNKLGYVGKYQFGYAALATLGYVKQFDGNDPRNKDNKNLENSSLWLNKNGLKSLEDYYKNGTVQELIMFKNLEYSYNFLKRKGAISNTDPPDKVAGLLSAAHIGGIGGALQLATKGITYSDGRKTTQDYYALGSKALEGESAIPAESLITDIFDFNVDKNSQLLSLQGFKDPNAVYPRADYAGQPDTNKLARGVKDHPSIALKDNTRAIEVGVANSTRSWSQPASPFGGVYPYNQVLETEAGHLLEFDNTPNGERINIYHKSGTFMEIDVNGTSVRKTIGDRYEVIDNNDYVYIRGAQNVTVDGSSKIFVKNNADIQVIGTTNIIGNNDVSIKSAGKLNLVGETVNISAKKGFNIVSDEQLKVQGKELNLFSKENNLTIKSSSKLVMQGTQSTSIDGGFELKMDATIIKTKMGATKIQEIKIPASDVPDKITPVLIDKPPKNGVETNQTTFLHDDPESAKSTAAQQLRDDKIQEGLIEDAIYNVAGTDSGNGSKPTAISSAVIAANCSDFIAFDKQNNFPKSIKLSRNFTLGNFVTVDPLKAQLGLSRADIACNLKFLAEQIELIMKKYPDVLVTSGFREDGKLFYNKKTGKNEPRREQDHGRGMAADLQFPAYSYPQYFTIVKWIRDNIPHKQLLLEFERRGTIVISWIHFAFDKSGSTSAMKTGTMVNHVVTAKNQFVNYFG